MRRAFRLAVQAGASCSVRTCRCCKSATPGAGFSNRTRSTAIGEALPEALRPVVKFAYATGWRTASEVLPLEWRNVDWNGRCVRLDAHTTKNGEARSFPFTAEIEKMLKAQLAEHERLKAAGTICPFVFQRDGERISDLPQGVADRLHGCRAVQAS